MDTIRTTRLTAEEAVIAYNTLTTQDQKYVIIDANADLDVAPETPIFSVIPKVGPISYAFFAIIHFIFGKDCIGYLSNNSADKSKVSVLLLNSLKNVVVYDTDKAKAIADGLKKLSGLKGFFSGSDTGTSLAQKQKFDSVSTVGSQTIITIPRKR